jgi:diadenosine tetraphosphate (Ap4A) HIT family hydrolase
MFCVFCEIVAGKLPSHTVWEDDNHLAFLGIFPNTKGMTIVIPKKHVSSYVFDVPEKVASDLLAAARGVAKVLDKKLPTNMRTALVFEGFGIDHLHAKLYPLHGEKGEWKQMEQTIDKFFEKYEGYVSTHEYKRADDKELAKLAKLLQE